MTTGTWLKIVDRQRWERVYAYGLAGFVRWRGSKYIWEVEDRVSGVTHKGTEDFAVRAKWEATRIANDIMRAREAACQPTPGPAPGETRQAPQDGGK